MWISSARGFIIIFQNGLLMQMLPAFGLGLYLQIPERPVYLGMLAGLLSLLLLVCTRNPLESYVPTVNVSVALNLVLGLAFLAPGTGGGQLTAARIRELMASSREPHRALVLLMLCVALISVPWYGTPGEVGALRGEKHLGPGGDDDFGRPILGLASTPVLRAHVLLGLSCLCHLASTCYTYEH